VSSDLSNGPKDASPVVVTEKKPRDLTGLQPPAMEFWLQLGPYTTPTVAVGQFRSTSPTGCN